MRVIDASPKDKFETSDFEILSPRHKNLMRIEREMQEKFCVFSPFLEKKRKKLEKAALKLRQKAHFNILKSKYNDERKRRDASARS